MLDGDRPIGTAGFHHVNEEDGNAAFGISIGEKQEWSKGYGTDALRAIDAARAERLVARMRELPALKDMAELAPLYA